MMKENADPNAGGNNNEDKYKKSEDVARKVLFSGGLLITMLTGQVAIAGMALGIVLMVYTAGRLIEDRKNDSWHPAADTNLNEAYRLLGKYVDPEAKFIGTEPALFNSYFGDDIQQFDSLTGEQQNEIQAALQQGESWMNAAKEDDIWLLKNSQLRNLIYFLAASILLISATYYFHAAFAITIAVLIVVALLVATTYDVYKITAGETNLYRADVERRKVADTLRGRGEHLKETVSPIVPSGWEALLFWQSVSPIPAQGAGDKQVETSIELTQSQHS